MRIALQRVGNSRGVIIPKPILAQVGFEKEVELEVAEDALVLRKGKRHPREGWEKASQALAKAKDDRLVWPEFGNAEDSELEW
jgi:antitoxin MazE